MHNPKVLPNGVRIWVWTEDDVLYVDDIPGATIEVWWEPVADPMLAATRDVLSNEYWYIKLAAPAEVLAKLANAQQVAEYCGEAPEPKIDWRDGEVQDTFEILSLEEAREHAECVAEYLCKLWKGATTNAE